MTDEEITATKRQFTGDARKYVNDVIKDLLSDMPDAIETRNDLKHLAASHFFNKVKESQQQWCEEKGIEKRSSRLTLL